MRVEAGPNYALSLARTTLGRHLRTRDMLLVSRRRRLRNASRDWNFIEAVEGCSV